MRTDERNARGWMLLGVIEYENDRLFEAASAFHRASRLEPMRYEPHFNTGAVLEKAGRYEQAIESYEAALKLAPDELAVMENLARCYIRAKTKLSVAKELIAKALPKEARPEWRIWLAEQLHRLEAGARDTPKGPAIR
ncbi:MAG: tetratricopeptide repeat protein [Phycisphaerae bacterium]|nr:tetratricopeptide repeat protein [Phycisphaerae bacterium]